jgi:hypothetical protein
MSTDAPTIRRCQHIKVNGIQCGSPAKRNEKYCYFHEEARVGWRQINMNVTDYGIINLPTLEDPNSIQLGLVEVMRLLVTRQIDHKIASLLLRALRIAAANVKFTNLEPDPTHIVIDPKCVGNRPLGASAWSNVAGRAYDLIPAHSPDHEEDHKEDRSEDRKEDHDLPQQTAQVDNSIQSDRDFVEPARPPYPGTEGLHQFVAKIFEYEMEGDRLAAAKVWREALPYFRSNPKSMEELEAKIERAQLDEEIAKVQSQRSNQLSAAEAITVPCAIEPGELEVS